MVSKKKVASALSWQVLNISVLALFQFIFLMISARVLPKQIHGAFAILNAIVFVLSFASEGGVSSALIQRKEVNSKHISISFYLTLGLSLFMCIIALSLSGVLAAFYDQKVTAFQIRIASTIFIFKALGSVSRAFLVKNFKYKELFIAKAISFFLGSICLMYLLAILDYGIYALIFGFIATQLIQSLLFYFYSKHSFTLEWAKTEFKQIAYFGSSFTVLRITNYLSTQVDKLLLGKFYALPLLSVYEKGQYISKMPSKYVGNSIDSVIFSYFSKINQSKKSKIFTGILLFIGLLASYFTVVFYFNADLIIKLLLGSNWIDSVPFLQILVFAIPALLYTRLGDIIVRSENKMFKSIPIKLGFFVSNILGILFFKELSIIEVTKILVIINWLNTIAMLLLSRSILHINMTRFIKPLVYSVLFFSVLSAKYFLINYLFEWSDIIYLLINFCSDALVVILLLRVFRNNKQLQMVLSIIRTRVNKKQSS